MVGIMTRYMEPFDKAFEFNAFCVDLYTALSTHKLVCGPTFNTGDASFPKTKIECDGYVDAYVVMKVCTAPCMTDPTSVCCYVPSIAAQN